MLRSAFADLHYEEQELIAGGDKVSMIVSVNGKYIGNFFGIPPTGNRISYQAVHIHRIGAIRDDLSLMMQLGVAVPSSPQYEPLFRAWKGLKR